MDIKEAFERSNEIICQSIESYFPGGTLDNRGWYQLKNFTRDDNKIGSFGICVSGTRPGLVKDFADESAKTNATGFYATVNNMSNVDACKKVLKEFDNSFYLLAFPPKNKIKYKPILPIPEKAYTEEFEDFCSNDSALQDNIDWTYEYKDMQGNILYVVVRVKTPVKQKDGKFRKTFSVGYFNHSKDDTKWKAFSWYKNPYAGKFYPFSKQDELAKQGKRNVLIVEGEKAARYLERSLSPFKWIVICIGSSSYLYNKDSYEIFKKLSINHAFYWPDNDEAGEKTIGFVKERFDKLSVVKIPSEEYYIKGWDGADAVIDGWNEDKIENFIFTNLYDNEELDPQYFKPIAHDHDNFYFMSYRLGLVKPIKQEAITLGFLKIMAPREFWINKYPPESGQKGLYDSDLAIEDVITMAIRTPYFENGKVRQLGAWEDDGRYVFHYGTGLFVNGKQTGLFDLKTENIYEKKGYLAFSDNKEPVPDLRAIGNIIKRFSISSPQEKYLFLGWIMLQIVGGALEWRPHIWLTGESGAGKSSAINFIEDLFGNSILKETGGSTEAGIRQRVKVSTLGVLIDEMESMDKKTEANVKSIKALIRIASSGGKISKGTTNHTGVDFAVKSMFCVGSISPQISENADRTRFAIINFDKSAQGTMSDWTDTEKQMREILTPEYTNAFKYFMATNVHKVIKAVEMSYRVFSDFNFDSRTIQLYGTLVAGAYICLRNGFDYTEEEYTEFVGKNFNFDDQKGDSLSTEAEQCLSIVMQTVIEYKLGNGTSDKNSIFELLKIYYEELKDGTDYNLRKNIVKSVKNYGFLVENENCNGNIFFVYHSKATKKALENTQFSGDIKEILKRHPKAKGIFTKTLYAGASGASIIFSPDILNEKLTKKEEHGINDNIPF